MKLRYVLASAATALIFAGVLAWAAPPGTINQYNAICDPLTAKQCARVDATGAMSVTATVNATSAAKATAAAPTYVEGTTNPISSDLSGALRVTGTINATSAVKATAAAPTYVEGSSNPVSSDLSGSQRVIVTSGGGPPTGSAGTPNAAVVSVQGISGGIAQDINAAKLNGGVIATGSGASNAQTQRVILSTDSGGGVPTGPAGTPATSVVTVQGIAGATAQPVDAAKLNGGAIATGSGASNPQTQRVILSTDSPSSA